VGGQYAGVRWGNGVNHLYYGDNLTIMQRMAKYSVDLIYLDPPFNSKQNYNLIYRNMTGMPVPDQADAFCDTWEMDPHKEEIARNMPMLMREHGVEDYYVEFWRLWIKALRQTQPHLLAYLIYMVQRLLHMKSLLRPTGSIYLHCDSTASHYIKVMMDGIFGHKNFRNEIIWKRRYGSSSAVHKSHKFGQVTDTILFYSMSDQATFNPQYSFNDPKYLEYVEKTFRHTDEKGRRYRIADLANPAPRPNLMYEYKGYKPPANGWAISREKMELWDKEGRLHFPKSPNGRIQRRRFFEELKGKPVQSLWDDIDMISSQDSDRLGYPTQKPVALVRRIIEASSNPGDVVFDPFCGCGTSIYAAEELGRKWIGCDIAILSIKLVREILTGDRYRLVEGADFDVTGVPVSVEQARELFKQDPFQFEHWLVERVGGFPTKKTGDKGVDGRLYFETQDGLKAMVLSVKGGKLRPTDVRDLIGVLANLPDTEMAGFLSLEEPSPKMREAAAECGQYEYNGVMYDRLQFLTVKDILEDKREFHTPSKLASKIASPQYSMPL
jgi:site-specific DNA-methyltransferase (adenine-specific)